MASHDTSFSRAAENVSQKAHRSTRTIAIPRHRGEQSHHAGDEGDIGVA
jgi:hypothetical protein